MQELSFDAIQGIECGTLLYKEDGMIKKIDIKKSAEYWWKIHHKDSILDFLLQKKSKNKYAGSKWFNFSEPYIRLYIDGDEIVFKKKLPEDLDTSDACEFRMWWEEINIKLNQLGYWLFDEG